jgi:hypothetical protein
MCEGPFGSNCELLEQFVGWKKVLIGLRVDGIVL